MKKSGIEDSLRALKTIRDAPESHDLKRDLAPFLRHKSNHVIAAAASIARRLEVAQLAPEMTAAFLDLMNDPAARDPGCKATTAIAEALAAMDQAASDVYLKGIRHVQMEASFGPPVDAAAGLRGLCAQGLARMSHPDAMEHCVTLLADKEVAARAGAVRAIGDSARPEGLLLLRLKALLGDKENEVIDECFRALLRLDPTRSLDFVASFLWRSSPEIAAHAALALGESHLEAAWPILRDASQQAVQSDLRRNILLAIAMLRQDEALEFLLLRLQEDSESSAADALSALALYARDDAVRARIEKLVHARKSRLLTTTYDREFRR